MTTEPREPLIGPRTVRTKDGRDALIRPVQIEDAPSLTRHNLAVHRTGQGVVRSLEQAEAVADQTEERIRRFVEGPYTGHWGYWPVAVMDGEIVGDGKVTREPLFRIRHVAHLSVSIGPGHQEIGLGRAIMAAMLDWARATRVPADPSRPQTAGVRRVTLDVFADNHRARRLYESLGFVEEGRRKAHILRDDGTFDDDLMMALRL